MVKDKRPKRIEDCFKLGLKFDWQQPGSYVKDDINISMVEITTDSDKVWDKKIAKIKKEIERRENGKSK